MLNRFVVAVVVVVDAGVDSADSAAAGFIGPVDGAADAGAGAGAVVVGVAYNLPRMRLFLLKLLIGSICFML